jgi:nitrate reductase delta subunit
MGSFALFAEMLRYPAPGRIEALAQAVAGMPQRRIQKSLAAFLKEIRSLSLGQWEELYTKTWDLEPLTAPYVGFQIWGEDYRRGKFMAALQQAYTEAGIELEGELPDHLVPVLHYLDVSTAPIPELTEAFVTAVEKMAVQLGKRDKENPYLHILKGILEAQAEEAKASS